MKNFDPIFLNSEYYTLLIHIMSKLLSHEVSIKDLYDKKFIRVLMRFFKECFNKKTVDHILIVVFWLSSVKKNRKLLCDGGIYTNLITLYESAIQDKNTSLLNSVLLNLSRLTLEKSFKVHFTEYLELNKNDYEPLFEPFKDSEGFGASDLIKAAA